MRKNTIILILLIIILAAGLVYFAFYSGNGVALAPSNLPSASATPSVSYAPNEWKTWTDTYYSKTDNSYFTYSIQYPRDFDVYPRENASGNLLVGTPLVKISFPQDAFQNPKTNFGEAYITLSMATGTQALTQCYLIPSFQGNQALATTTTIGGIQFKTGHTVDVGAGNIYDSQVYRTIFNNRCFEAIETVHTGNIANYTPGTVTEFDKSLATVVLDQMLQTLTLSNKAPTQ